MSQSLSRKDILASTILVEGGLAVLAVILAWLLGPDLWSHITWSWNVVWWGGLGAVPPLVIILLIDRFPVGPLRHVADISEQFLRPLLRNCRWPDYFLLATLAGFCEELLFRGWLQPFLTGWTTLWASVLISGFVFALCHMITPAYFIIAWLISIYLAALLIWTDNLLVPMLTHGVYDLIALFAVMGPQKEPITNEPELLTLPSESPDSLPVAPNQLSSDTAPDSDA